MKSSISLKKDGSYYIGVYHDGIGGVISSETFPDFLSCAQNAAYHMIDVYDKDMEYLGYLELIGGDYE